MQKAIYSDTYASLVAWLVSSRKDRKLSQRDLASLLQVHHSVVGKVEICERRLDVVEYLQFCQALDANPLEGMRVMESKQLLSKRKPLG